LIVPPISRAELNLNTISLMAEVANGKGEGTKPAPWEIYLNSNNLAQANRLHVSKFGF